ncbi:hypothetical protein EYW49_02100 [Siculibacillus lacustris]|uniref:Uncharacterized protein n=1 Tax=Siculibacillus lacustris TaxID=1549641 RepID=A0A4Q9VXG1_9HYPH|nr:hypothetical protein [Siculibacillus lacustris]TBW40971.1 hypothetical protein EYW49_02100 [Siculibacillus lacustris]
MPEPGLLTSKVRAYMESLTPMARAMLVRSLRASASHGDIPNEVILAAIEGLEIAGEPTTPVRRPASAPAPTVGEPWSQRLESAFFAPLAPFLVDDSVTPHLTGRIARAHLPVIWNWIRRDAAAEDVDRALAADPYDAAADATPVARKLRRDAMVQVVGFLRDAGTESRARQKLIGQLGGEAIYRDLVDVAYVLQNEAAFANLFAQLPSNITTFDVAEPSRLADVIRASIEQVQMTLEWITAAVLTRTANPVVVAHLACRLVGSSDPRLVAGSRYACLIEGLLALIERHAACAKSRGTDPQSRTRFFSDLRSYHDISRSFGHVFVIEDVPTWFRRLGAARVVMSEAVSQRIEVAPGLVRRALRVEASGGQYGSRFDPEAVEDAEFAVRLSIEARLAAETLAVNEVVGRIRKQIETTLEHISGKLLADLKASPSLDRRALVDASDAAIRLAAIVFGEDYAAVLRKSRDNALQKPAKAAG